MSTSPHSIDCSPHSSPHSTTCSASPAGVLNVAPCIAGPDPFTSAAGPIFMTEADTIMTSMCSTASPIPPATSMLTSVSFPPTEIENKCINSMALLHPQNCYPPISQHHDGVFIDHGIPSFTESFGQPAIVPPPQTTSPAALSRASSESSIPEGELPIRMVDQQYRHDPSLQVAGAVEPITYYPPTPESPATRQNIYNCGPTDNNIIPMSKAAPGFPYLPPVSQPSICIGAYFPPPPKPVNSKGELYLS